MAKSPTSPGRMTARLRFDAWAKVGDDPGGGDKMGWVTQFYRWGEIRPDKGSEEVVAQRLQGMLSARLFVRYDPQTAGVTPAWRAVEVTTHWVLPDGGEEGDPLIEVTLSEICAYALKTSADMERNRAFITMQAVAGAADA